MNFNEYQKRIEDFCIYPDHDKFGIIDYPFYEMMGEFGELCEKVKKIKRDKKGVISEEDKLAISLELGDMQFALNRLTTHFQLDMQTVVNRNINKLQSRKERNAIKGSGDIR